MICEKCKIREARVKITKVINGVTEVHNLCPKCAVDLRLLDTGITPEWSNAIFRLLSDTQKQNEGRKKAEPYDEKLKLMECPTCHKKYGDFLADGAFGCSDCYEAFSPSIDQMILSMQGADSHTGKRPLSYRDRIESGADVTEEMLTPEEEAEMLKIRLQEAVYAEDYEQAAVLRDQLKALEKAGKS